jgi:hypothetical protein
MTDEEHEHQQPGGGKLGGGRQGGQRGQKAAVHKAAVADFNGANNTFLCTIFCNPNFE